MVDHQTSHRAVERDRIGHTLEVVWSLVDKDSRRWPHQRMRAALCFALSTIGCSSSAQAIFHATDSGFRPSPGSVPKLYDRSNVAELRMMSVRSVGRIEVNVPESSGKRRVIELAVEKGRELGCWVLVEHSAFLTLKMALEDGARIFLAHGGGHDASPGALRAEFDCVLRIDT